MSGEKSRKLTPFYEPPHRKTSAEIISEARAAIFGVSEVSSSNTNNGSSLRALPTKRPFTPREPQRTLFSQRPGGAKRDTRPPSSFGLDDSLSSLRYLLSGDGDGGKERGHVSSLDDTVFRGLLLAEPDLPKRRQLRAKARSVQGSEDNLTSSASSGSGGLPKLPNLNGHSKPLHRRGNIPENGESLLESFELSTTITTKPLLSLKKSGSSVSDSAIAPSYSAETVTGSASSSTSHVTGTVDKSKSRVSSSELRRIRLASLKTNSQLQSANSLDLGSIAVKKLDVQIPDAVSSLEKDAVNEALEQLAACKKGAEPVKVSSLLEVLYEAVEALGGCLALGSKERAHIMRTLYVHIDSEDERTLVQIARLLLAMRVTGSNLSTACKLVFKVARLDANDHLFLSTNVLELVVEGIGRACPLTEGECCVYGAGALRFLALEPRLRARALSAGALHLAALHMKILNNAKAESHSGVSEQSAHALYQLTGALRNLAAGADDRDRDLEPFIASGALAELVAALQVFVTDRDVVTNVVRALSVLSADGACCAWLGGSRNACRALLRALAACAARPALAVRLAYTLGNLAAAHQTAIATIYEEEDGIDILLAVLESYLSQGGKGEAKHRIDSSPDPDLYLVGCDLGGSDGSYEDVLIKTVRVIANVCLCGRAGRGIVSAHGTRCVRALLACLELAATPPPPARAVHAASQDVHPSTDRVDMGAAPGGREERDAIGEREELAAAALATLNNLTFYHEPAPAPHADPLAPLLERASHAACEWVSVGGGAAACEAVRVLGNLTRALAPAQHVLVSGTLPALEPFLYHEEAFIRSGVAGILVNVSGWGLPAAQATLSALNTLARVRQSDGERDTHTAALLARALHNAHAHSPLAPSIGQQAQRALHLFIDDESVFAGCKSVRRGSPRADGDSDRNSLGASAGNFLSTDERNEMGEINNNSSRDSQCNGYDPRYENLDREVVFDGEERGVPDEGICSGDELGLEEEEDCECPSCSRLSAWEELMGVAVPLLSSLQAHAPAHGQGGRADASVGTD